MHSGQALAPAQHNLAHILISTLPRKHMQLNLRVHFPYQTPILQPERTFWTIFFYTNMTGDGYLRHHNMFTVLNLHTISYLQSKFLQFFVTRPTKQQANIFGCSSQNTNSFLKLLLKETSLIQRQQCKVDPILRMGNSI